MSNYLGRLRQGRYRSPSGQLFRFECDEVQRTSGKKTSEYDYPFYDGGDIADLGITIPTYPLEIYFKGSDYDIEADRFWAALWEEGEGLLEHPRWGNLTVIPVDFEQKEGLVMGMGRAVFTVTFKEVSAPQETVTQKGQEMTLEQDINDSLALLPGNLLDIAATSLAAFKEKILEPLNFLNTQISRFYDVAAEFNSLLTAFEVAFDSLLNTPQAFVTALYSLYELPSRSALNMRNKIKLYHDMLSDISATGFLKEPFFSLTADERKGLYLSMHVGALGYASAMLDGTFTDRRDALDNIAAFIGSYRRYSSVVSALETGNRPAVAANPDSELALKKTFSTALSVVILYVDTLKRIGRRVLAEDMTPVQAVYSRYGNTDRLDEFIEINALRNDEIFLMSKGRTVLFYE